MKTRVILTFLLLLSMSPMATAVSIYTDKTGFLNDLSIPYSNLNFDSMIHGETIANGEMMEGITFQYDFGGTELMVSNIYDSVSTPNFLGTNDASVLQDGDDLQLSFDSVNAIGFSFITADAMFDNDIFLSIGNISVGLDSSDIQQTLADGSNVFFLGLINNETAFSSAEITTIGGGFFSYNVDDIVTAKSIPVPAILMLIVTGITLLSIFRKVS